MRLSTIFALFCLLVLSVQVVAKSHPKPLPYGFPVKVLNSKDLKVTVLLPDEQNGYYRSTRFDWSGIIAQVEYNGHTFFQEWEHYEGTTKPGVHNPMNNGTGTGTAEEFRGPLGYDEAKIGEPFVKIGVGILEKAENKPHHWAYPYKVVKFGEWETDSGKDKISFKQDLNTGFGYGYRYKKQLILSENSPEITVKHTLTNTGQKNIQTNPYCHNFMRFDDDFIGENYKIAFCNPIRAISNFGSKATFSDNSFMLNYNLTDEKPVEGFINVNQSKVFTLSNNKTGTFVTVSTDVVPDSFYLYTWRMAFCPEPMIQIDIIPGESFTWNTTYKFGKQTKEN